MARIVINGREYSGDNVRVSQNNIFVDGDLIGRAEDGQKELTIRVTEGVINRLDAGGSVYCGEVLGDVDAGGSVTVTGNVAKSVDAGGSVEVNGNVGGSVDSGGSARVGGSVSGSIDAGGSVKIGR